jgi:hypothetical protein
MKRAVMVLLGILLLAGTANAALVAGWDMAGQPGNQTSVAGRVAVDGITALDMVRGAGLSPSEGSNSFNSSGWNASNADDYFQFGFSVAEGYSVTLDELWIGSRSSGTGPGTIGVYTSVDGFTNAIGTIVQNNTAFSNSIIDLSVLGTISGDFYVRLYEVGDTQADGSGATASAGTFRIADYYEAGTNIYIDTHFEGTVVPVPGALWLLGSALIGVVGLRKKTSK